MSFRARNAFWPFFCFALLLLFILGSGRLTLPSAAAQFLCPPGESPLEVVSLADVVLTNGAPPYARMALSRITLAPGETLEETPEGFTAYYVESGVLKVTFQPGFDIFWTPQCTSPDGHHFSGAGVSSLDDDGMQSISQGETIVSDVLPIGPITNDGTSPLIVLQMTLILPEIDPTTGLPIIDPATAGRIAVREFERQKQACKAAARSSAAGTPSDDALMEDGQDQAMATPAVVTAGWETDSRDRDRRVPRACRG